MSTQPHLTYRGPPLIMFQILIPSKGLLTSSFYTHTQTHTLPSIIGERGPSCKGYNMRCLHKPTQPIGRPPLILFQILNLTKGLLTSSFYTHKHINKHLTHKHGISIIWNSWHKILSFI